MSTLAVIALVVGILLVLLFVGGLIGAGRRARSLDDSLRERIAAANGALAQAHALDKGWERDTVEAAAREAFAQQHPGETVEELHLVQVIDRPGTDSDEAVFTLRTAGGVRTLTLGRRDGSWIAL